MLSFQPNWCLTLSSTYSRWVRERKASRKLRIQITNDSVLYWTPPGFSKLFISVYMSPVSDHTRIQILKSIILLYNTHDQRESGRGRTVLSD